MSAEPRGPLARWRRALEYRRTYTDARRAVYYDVVRPFLPTDAGARIVDVGCGGGDFGEHLQLCQRYGDVWFLDGNPERVRELLAMNRQAALYVAPERLPFSDGTVALLHCSHLVEHLYPHEFHRFLGEIDRVLAYGAILVVSTPLLWSQFYVEAFHIRPYPPGTFLKYLTADRSRQPSGAQVSLDYTLELLIPRFTTEVDHVVGSSVAAVDLPIQFLRQVIRLLGIRTFTQNGYTLILRKGRGKTK